MQGSRGNAWLPFRFPKPSIPPRKCSFLAGLCADLQGPVEASMGGWATGGGEAALQSCCVISLPAAAAGRARVYLGAEAWSPAEGGPADPPPGAHSPAGSAAWGGREDRRLTAILDAVTRSRPENYCRGRVTGLELGGLGLGEPFRGEGAHVLVGLH